MIAGTEPLAHADRFALRTGAIAGVVAAVVEMVPVLSIQAAALGVGPLRVLQAIASGLLGRPAFAGGLATAVLGAALHLVISVVAGMVYAAAARRWQALNTHPLLAAAGYGAIVYAVMSFVVVPLSAAPFPRNADPVLMATSLAVHIVAFALPITLIVRHRTGSRTTRDVGREGPRQEFR